MQLLTSHDYTSFEEQMDEAGSAREEASCDDSFMAELLAGLSRTDRAVPCRFLYDAAGSALFDQICELPEYYPTRTECSILKANAAEMAAAIGNDVRFVELGAGSGGKAEILMDQMPGARSYVCIDISPVPLAGTEAAVKARYPGLDVSSVCGNYLGDLDLPEAAGLRDVCFFPGSTIGNFERDDARAFLTKWRERLGPRGMMLVGVDLKKDPTVLEQAYDDAQGVTARFSLNLLSRANRELGADFDTDCFQHRARYIAEPGHIEITLVSKTEQVVSVGGRAFAFAPGETIHVENSHKYGVAEFAELAGDAGFDVTKVWTDENKLFSVQLITAKA